MKPKVKLKKQKNKTFNEFKNQNEEKYKRIIEKEKIRTGREELLDKHGNTLTLESMLLEDYEKEVFFFKNVFAGSIIKH